MAKQPRKKKRRVVLDLACPWFSEATRWRNVLVDEVERKGDTQN